MSGAAIILLGQHSQHSNGFNYLGRDAVFIVPSVEYGEKMLMDAVKKTFGYNQVNIVRGYFRYIQKTQYDKKGVIVEQTDKFYFKVGTYNNKHYLAFEILEKSGEVDLPALAVADCIVSEEKSKDNQ